MPYHLAASVQTPGALRVINSETLEVVGEYQTADLAFDALLTKRKEEEAFKKLIGIVKEVA